MHASFRGLLIAALSLACLSGAQAQTELNAAQLKVIKQKLAQRLPQLPPIESARTTPMSGLVELKAGNSVLYSDMAGEYVFEGHMVETRTQRNLTQERLEDINRIDFSVFPLKDAIAWKSGTGRRRLVVFADPNCGYCKQLERELQQVKDVTVYTFMIPILSDDSKVKVENIWCLKDRTQAWRDWMLEGVKPARGFGMCASPTQRNMALAHRLNITGTPAVFFEDGTRLPGAASASQIEQRLRRADPAAN